ncbi:glycosyltransferase [Rhizobium sp. VS19-DR104.2]|uniref:glycosyltransferase n=1 Tax=unclassified Rhizobium TaxID=2613769 RepID=UPI001CC77613|nr:MULTISPECIES: glycosyltransferase [unclassified Rhizobium]MBZ5761964.1 glycosyltransferase [Rhizobium sp. VS19-DR96]MBZ5768390.1 glycosyltransferase [Rhizobium sp. VS19-DR129.2]MBZ5775660.1 glycosyltransferase [Rhizobium sp. VS19-DRK62.2]MBZ5786842.1 glycosyltransferase [Rhizobium sp. VS19-DR121]MBZ5804412.1 glycosyltransferase [Rhizobium sp. VS19-DR181]
MRVLHFFKTYQPNSFGGVERTICAIAKGALEHNIHSDVLSLSRNPVADTSEFNGHNAYKAKLDFEFASTGFSLSAFSRFKELSARADIIHYHFPWPFMDVVHLTHRPNKPTVVTYHSDIIKQKSLLKLYRPLMHQFLSSVDNIVATSPNYLQTSEVLKKYAAKVEVIPIGLDPADYPRASSELKLRWKERFPKPFFLFVGVLRYYKGLHTLIEASTAVEADILIAGNGPMEKELKAQAALTGNSNVHFLGQISDLDKAALLEMCVAFVFPSHLRSEAYGLSLVEAAMFGKPMISCEIGTGTSYVNKHDETGIVVSPENPEALRNAMFRLQRSPDNTKLFGINAALRFKSTLTADRMANLYCELYQRLATSYKS